MLLMQHLVLLHLFCFCFISLDFIDLVTHRYRERYLLCAAGQSHGKLGNLKDHKSDAAVS